LAEPVARQKGMLELKAQSAAVNPGYQPTTVDFFYLQGSRVSIVIADRLQFYLPMLAVVLSL
jgi:hypothetical protein